MPAATLAANPWGAGHADAAAAAGRPPPWPPAGFPPLAPGAQAVLLLPLDGAVDDWLAPALAVLAPGERTRLGRFAFVRDARQYAAARVLLRHALGHYLGCDAAQVALHQDGAGKPYVGDGAGIDVSISHCDGCVAIGLARGGRIGIDVESLEREHADYLTLARQFYAPSEYEALRAAAAGQGAVRFVEAWTLKEAYVKALGVGLGKSLDECVFTFDAGAGLGFRDSAARGAHDGDWRFRLYAALGTYRLAIATEAPALDGGPGLHVGVVTGAAGAELRLLRSGRAAGQVQP